MMRLLVIGIDGGDKRIIDAMDMPTLKSLLTDGVCMEVEEDLWSRGWAEILGGVHGRELGAFYAKPKLDGTHGTTQKFGSEGYDANPSVTPLWSQLVQAGCRVGFMNVPSMMPAPEVNGFIVSGGGAGASTSGASRIPDAACFPRKMRHYLEDVNYILDTRFLASGIREKKAFLNRLSEMQGRRTEAFSQLCLDHAVDFGFVAYMATTRMQYLAMSEIEAVIENSGSPRNSFQEGICALYRDLDGRMAGLLEALQPESVMIVADHGGGPRLHSANVNAWLKATDRQRPLRPSLGMTKRLARSLAGILPQGVKRGLSSTAPDIVARVTAPDVEWDRTEAFGVRYIPGIYINDRRRFGGPVGEEETEPLVQKLITEFNATGEAREHELKARVYGRVHQDAQYADLQPDIWIDHPDTIFFEQHGGFIEPNPDYGPIESLHQVDRDQYTGIKRRYPLLCVDRQMADRVDAEDAMDLTLAYKLIVRAMDA